MFRVIRPDFEVVKEGRIILQGIMQKPGVLTTFGRSDYNNNIYLNIRDLTPAMSSQYIPAKGGQGHWLFHFSRSHYEDKGLSLSVKPPQWLKEWLTNKNNIRDYHWKSVFVIKYIESFSYDTYKFLKFEGGHVTKAPQNYVRVKNPLLHLSI